MDSIRRGHGSQAAKVTGREAGLLLLQPAMRGIAAGSETGVESGISQRLAVARRHYRLAKGELESRIGNVGQVDTSEQRSVIRYQTDLSW